MQYIVSWWQDGVHMAKKDKEEMMTEEQKKVMRTQDIKYVEMKRVAEAKVSSKVPVINSKQNVHSGIFNKEDKYHNLHYSYCSLWFWGGPDGPLPGPYRKLKWQMQWLSVIIDHLLSENREVKGWAPSFGCWWKTKQQAHIFCGFSERR